MRNQRKTWTTTTNTIVQQAGSRSLQIQARERDLAANARKRRQLTRAHLIGGTAKMLQERLEDARAELAVEAIRLRAAARGSGRGRLDRQTRRRRRTNQLAMSVAKSFPIS
ncbi:unnamed protein product [Sphagnum tenellum]